VYILTTRELSYRETGVLSTVEIKTVQMETASRYLKT